MKALFKYSLILAIALTGTAGATKAQIRWEEEPQFDVRVSGKLDASARIYRPDDHQPKLIYLSKKFNAPLLIDLSSKKITKLSTEDLTAIDDYTYSTKGVPAGKSIGSYTMESGASVFKYNGKSVSIKIKQTLVGEVPESVLLTHSPEYAVLRDSYKPKSKYVKKLKSVNKPIEIVVMFATWCPTCKEIVPRFLKVKDKAGNAKFSVKYVGIAMGGNEPSDLLDKYGHDYPAFIFYHNGKEVDRIVGDPPVPIEQVMSEILAKV